MLWEIEPLRTPSDAMDGISILGATTGTVRHRTCVAQIDDEDGFDDFDDEDFDDEFDDDFDEDFDEEDDMDDDEDYEEDDIDLDDIDDE